MARFIAKQYSAVFIRRSVGVYVTGRTLVRGKRDTDKLPAHGGVRGRCFVFRLPVPSASVIAYNDKHDNLSPKMLILLQEALNSK